MMQRDACDLAPVGTFRVRIEQTQIRDEVTSSAAVGKLIPSWPVSPAVRF
jgi:hypothetical protein